MLEIIENIKKRKYVIALILLLLLAIPSVNDTLDLYTNHVKKKTAIDNLLKINSGVSMKYVESVFGAPIIEKRYKDDSVIRQIFSFNDYYLMVLYDKDNTVIYYAITAKEKGFRAKIPYTDLVLGDFTFDEVRKDGTLDSTLSAKFYRYSEYGELAAPGNYRNLYLSYNPAGIDYSEDMDYPSLEKLEDENELSKFRKMARPNTYGIGRSLASEKELSLVKNYGVGIDFYETDLPTEAY